MVIAGYDPQDSASGNEPVPNYAAELSRGASGLRLGLDREHFFSPRVQPDVRVVCEGAIKTLQSLGAEIVEVRLPELEFASAAGMPILLTDTSEWHKRFLVL
jgi:aspartyl-tRNA(Asn)/glutamyl-tRNA(Gln) amidotransferase subunit A